MSRFNTWLTPALVAFFLSPQLPVANEYFSPSVMNCCFNTGPAGLFTGQHDAGLAREMNDSRGGGGDGREG